MISSLIWDYIFADPEFGGMLPFEFDGYGCMDRPNNDIGIIINLHWWIHMN